MDVEWTPDDRDRAPDDNFENTAYQARLAAHHLLTCKEQGLCEQEAIELTKEFIASVLAPKEDGD